MNGLTDFALRISTLLNIRNLVLLLVLFYFCCITLLLPNYHTTAPITPSPLQQNQTHPIVDQDELVESMRQYIAVIYSKQHGTIQEDINGLRSTVTNLSKTLNAKIVQTERHEEKQQHIQSAHAADIALLSTKAKELQNRNAELRAVLVQHKDLQQQQLLNSTLHAQHVIDQCKQIRNHRDMEKERRIEEQVGAIISDYNQTQLTLEKVSATSIARRQLTKQALKDMQDLQDQLQQSTITCQEQIELQRQQFKTSWNDSHVQQLIDNQIKLLQVTISVPVKQPCPACICKACPKCPPPAQPVTVDCQQICRDLAKATRHQDESSLYHLDVDFALYKAGTVVVQSLTSPTFIPSQLRVDTLIKNQLSNVGLADLMAYVPTIAGTDLAQGMGLGLGTGSPVDALVEDLSLGKCWPMQGSRGNFTIQLLHPVTATAFSIDHILKSEALDWRTAPRAFSIYGASDRSQTMRWLLDGVFAWENDASSQAFLLPSPVQNLSVFSLAIHSNHGHRDYTCLYRMRVHGHVA